MEQHLGGVPSTAGTRLHRRMERPQKCVRARATSLLCCRTHPDLSRSQVIHMATMASLLRGWPTFLHLVPCTEHPQRASALTSSRASAFTASFGTVPTQDKPWDRLRQRAAAAGRHQGGMPLTGARTGQGRRGGAVRAADLRSSSARDDRV